MYMFHYTNMNMILFLILALTLAPQLFYENPPHVADLLNQGKYILAGRNLSNYDPTDEKRKITQKNLWSGEYTSAKMPEPAPYKKLNITPWNKVEFTK